MDGPPNELPEDLSLRRPSVSVMEQIAAFHSSDLKQHPVLSLTIMTGENDVCGMNNYGYALSF